MSLSEGIKTLLVDFALLCVFLSPWIVPYCVWRFLRDLRRIAVAVEMVARNEDYFLKENTLYVSSDPAPPHGRVANSAFGR